MRSVSWRGLGSIWSCVLISLSLSACGAEPGDRRGDGAGADTGGDTTPAVTPGVAGGPCYPNNTCNDGLACTGGICADPGAAAGVVGGPCYPNDTCNAGLVCMGAVCAVASVDDTGVDTGSDTGGSGDTRPAPDTDTPPVEETIGPAGGTVEFEGIRLTIPAGALSADTAITISYAEEQAPAGYERYTPVYRFEPAGTTFAIPATVSARFNGDAGRATLFWTPEGATGFERRGGRVGGDGRFEEQVTHFSEGFVGDGVRYTDSSDRNCVVTRLLEGRNATGAGINGGLALFFTVDDCEGRPVTGLTNADFRLLEDGRPLSSEAQATVLPADGRGIFVSLVLDFSSSTEPVLPDLLDGAAAFLTALEEARLPAQVQIMAFGGDATAYVAQRYTLDVASARAALTGLSAWRPTDIGATNLHGAVVQALSASASAQSAFRARNRGGAFSSGYVVVFTDGGDTAERVTLEQVQSAVSGSPDEVFMVGLRGADYDASALTAIAPARNVLAAPGAAEIAREFAALANRIAGQALRTYLLGYCSPKRAGSHTVSVEVAGSENRSTASFNFGADGFTGSCRAAAFATVCEGNECGGLGCGACDDRTTGCVTAGSSFVCEDLCILLNECTGEPLVTDLGLPLVCPETLDRTLCGARCISVREDVNNCGGCGTSCDLGELCNAGVCGPPVCPGGCAAGLACVAPGVCVAIRYHVAIVSRAVENPLNHGNTPGPDIDAVAIKSGGISSFAASVAKVISGRASVPEGNVNAVTSAIIGPNNAMDDTYGRVCDLSEGQGFFSLGYGDAPQGIIVLTMPTAIAAGDSVLVFELGNNFCSNIATEREDSFEVYVGPLNADVAAITDLATLVAQGFEFVGSQTSQTGGVFEFNVP